MPSDAQVLVVDDDAAIRLLCRINLEVDGYVVREAATIDAARAELAEGGVRTVLLDVHVGGGDGLALLEEIRRDYPGTSVALLTGTADADSLRAARPDALVPKPFTLELLLDTVARLSGTSR